jgi:hypothetical protein
MFRLVALQSGKPQCEVASMAIGLAPEVQATADLFHRTASPILCIPDDRSDPGISPRQRRICYRFVLKRHAVLDPARQALIPAHPMRSLATRIAGRGQRSQSRQHVPGGISMTAKRTYRMIPRKDGSAYDVEMSEPGCPPRIVNTFNSEAAAWEWLNEQRHVDRFERRMSRNPKGHGGPQ